MSDALIDSILRMFNIKLFIIITQKETSSDKSKSAYDDLAKLILPTMDYIKYTKYATSYKKAYIYLHRHNQQLRQYYEKATKTFGLIYELSSTPKSNRIQYREQSIHIIQQLAITFDKLFWDKIFKIDKDSLIKSIFVFYGNPDLSLSESDTIMIVDRNDYILYRNGDIYNTILTRYFEFDSTRFTTTSIIDKERITRIVIKSDHKFLMPISPIYTSELTLYDISILYDSITTAINGLIMISHIDDVTLTKESELLPNTTKFLGILFNTKRGEFTNRNNMMYTILFCNKLKLFMDLVSNVLTNRLDLSLSNDVRIETLLPTMNRTLIDDTSETVYNVSTSKDLLVDQQLYDIIRPDTGSIIKAYNYFNLVTLTNKIDTDSVKCDPLQMLYLFLVELKTFLIGIVQFKTELLTLSVFQNSYVNDHPDEFVKLFVYAYIVHVIRDKSNIHISKIRTIETFLNIDSDNINTINIINTNNYNPNDLKLSMTIGRWIENTSMSKPSYRRVKEYSDTRVGNETFPGCGETLTLNVMNYILLDPDTGKFVLPPNSSKKLIEYYSKRQTIDDVLKSERQSVDDWATLISKRPKIKYNNKKHECELIPSAENVLCLFLSLIHFKNVKSQGIEGLLEFVKTADPKIRASVLNEDNDEDYDPDFEILLLNDFSAKFSEQHGEMDMYVDPKDRYKNKRYIKWATYKYYDVLQTLHDAANEDVITRLIFLEKLDLVQSKEVMRIININLNFFMYALRYSSYDTIYGIMFNDYSSSELMNIFLTCIGTSQYCCNLNTNTCRNEDEDTIYLLRIKLLTRLNIMLPEVLKRVTTNNMYLNVIYEYVQRNITIYIAYVYPKKLDLRIPSNKSVSDLVGKLISFMKTIDHSTYISIKFAHKNPILTSVMMDDSYPIIKQLIDDPRSRDELSNGDSFDTIINATDTTDNVKIKTYLFHTPYLEFSNRYKHLWAAEQN